MNLCFFIQIVLVKYIFDQLHLPEPSERDFIIAVDHTVDHNQFAKCDRFSTTGATSSFSLHGCLLHQCFCHFHKIHTVIQNGL